MKEKMKRRMTAMVMAVVFSLCAVVSPNGSQVFASDMEITNPEETNAEPVLYDEAVRTDLDEKEVVTAKDITVTADSGFDVVTGRDGITYDEKAVEVSYYTEKGAFDGNVAGEYDTYYKVVPVSGKDAYLVHRVISVREPETETESVSESDTTEESGSDDEEE